MAQCPKGGTTPPAPPPTTGTGPVPVLVATTGTGRETDRICCAPPGRGPSMTGAGDFGLQLYPTSLVNKYSLAGLTTHRSPITDHCRSYPPGSAPATESGYSRTKQPREAYSYTLPQTPQIIRS